MPPKSSSSSGGGGGLPALSSDDMCPVCKTIRYLNKDMEFLIHPDCYHSMCSNCVNRLFNDGPNQCPYAGCHKTLRRKGFRAPFFGDLSVEREVDIRRRVAAVFNQVEDDFETLLDYNNYLQMVEDLTFELVHGTDQKRQQAEAQLQAWEAEHRADIERNRRAGREADDLQRRRIAAERDAARQRRIEAIKEAEEEKRERVRSREAELDSMQTGEAAGGGGGGGQRVQLKRRGQVSKNTADAAAANMIQDKNAAGAAAAAAAAGADGLGVGRLSIRGLKEKKRPPPPEGPYDPFGGLDFVPSRYTLEPKGTLNHPALDHWRLDQGHITGGYSFDEYISRAMFDAFAGLGVFIEDEKELGGQTGLSAGQVATIGAGIAAVGDKMELDAS